MTEHSDIELLDAYASRRSEEAFRELVTRHVDFIYSASMRQLRNPHLAQEATQSAFIALAGKAGHLRRHTIIAGWLHHAAHFAALKLQRSEARRKHWEREAAAMNVSGEDENAFQELVLPHIDDALAELSEADRDAIILRFLRQQSLRDVAQVLGLSEEAAKKRVSRALEKLRGLLTQRGVAIPAVALAAGLSQMPVTAAPATLPTSLVALATHAGGPALLTLTTLTKTKLAVIIGLGILGGLTILLWPARVVNTTTAPTNSLSKPSMKIKITSVMVNDQDKALKFYTEVLGFVKKTDLPVDGGRWLTVVSPAEPDGTELLLEPLDFQPARIFQAALYKAGIPLTTFMAEDIQKKYEQMTKLGAVFSMKPTKMRPTTVAVFDDTCGNRIQIFQPPGLSNSAAPLTLKIKIVSVVVANQDQALKFYTEVLGFVKKQDMPAGGGRWLTVVSPDEPEVIELLLEPMGFAPAKVYQKALFDAGIPLTSFAVDDIQKECGRMKKFGVTFRAEPTKMGSVTAAVFEDTCGNLIQLVQR